ncbi:LLM class flavin-dependent oxidoreductase [Streptomyces syringium]|uniref:Alkanesulfonate monooxygenase SsuD/methylene tetrahydromethanopterin reductase-like flavin-dependent oxidoreductase (Luciferase family) n=1 Tax=Streptomyces syringium TaxID=76729 RepID=A0ABS4Y210_9ACTN|nr:LLM class flavin-dependent oxidoreductase [Streptomyces syringium]MBP2402769.1 alkanesulfonate monooxygenase SsuD/methylene tetrahydromethanopterin reductase-like flavin-dependent oxidoreductase (luciferase family) [Streptomyces syringium]
MKIGLGLPIDDPALLLSWAQRADASPFSTLGLLDRLVFDNPEPLITLATLAGATSRIRLQTEVLIAPVHNTAILAKQTATLDRLSGGRFTLGIGVGGREDDCLAAGIDIRRRGRRLDEQMPLLRRTWAGEPYGADAGPIGPAPSTPGGPEVLFGGFSPAAIERVGQYGDGFLGAALPPPFMADLYRSVEAVWEKYDRSGSPRLVAQVNVALGSQSTVEQALRNIRSYYDFTGRADHVANGLLTTPQAIRDAAAAFTGIGADEVILYCWSSDIDQVDRLADVLF